MSSRANAVLMRWQSTPGPSFRPAASPAPGGASGADSLTASERRIADIAAFGASNVEIAQGLFVTLKTVEMHLTHTYRKLEITERAELPEALADAGDQPSQAPKP